MDELLLCPSCGLPTPSGMRGLCPACLLKLGFVKATEPALDTMPASGSQIASSVDLDLPARIGPYTLVQRLGEGGMGVVYLAEQRDPIRRVVALKLIKLGMDTAEVVARFETERQALAIMDHPNIAHVYDAGATLEGRPYFVMEYVPGLPISDYCDTHALTIKQRVELIITVCSAIQHAHQKGVIHRDLKPSNILVTEDEGRPLPKVIDFGVAKATDRILAERKQFTEHGRLIGTVEYMSPEQADPAAADVDTRTDIYALGVILYEILVGTLPFSPVRLRQAGYSELLRIIRDEEPPRPSARLTTSDVAGEAPGRRRTTLSGLSAQLRGDLDWITLKALEKERTRRYASASEFSADLGRYLNNEPVLARPAAAGYRIRKFVRRNRLVVSAASIVFVSVVAGLVVSSVLFVKERAALTDARIARQEAFGKAASEARARATAETAAAAEAQARERADAQTLVAQKALTTAETNLYFNNVNLADRECAAGNVANADRLLADAPARLRDWEWAHLRQLCHMEQAVLAGHTAPIRGVVFSPDGERLVSVSSDFVIKTWNVRTHRQIGTVRLDHGQGTEASVVAFSPDGTSLASTFVRVTQGQSSRRFKVWDVASGRERFTLAPPGNIFMASFTFSPDGRKLLTSTTAVEGLGLSRNPLRSYDVTTGRELAGVANPANLATARLAFSQDGRLLAVAGSSSIKILDADTGKEQIDLVRSNAAIAIAFSPDGTAIAAGIGAGGVRLWSVSDGKERWSANDDRRVTALTFSRDGQLVVVALGDRTLRVLDRATGAERQQLIGHPARIGALAFGSNGTTLASGGDDRTIRLWNLRAAVTPIVLNQGEPEEWVRMAQLRPDGRLLVALLATQVVKGWDTRTGQQIFTAAAPRSKTSPTIPASAGPVMEFSADGARLAVPRILYFDTGGGRTTIPNEVQVMETSTGRAIIGLRPSHLKGREIEPEAIPASGQIIVVPSNGIGLSPRADRAAVMNTTPIEMQRVSGVIKSQAAIGVGVIEFWDVRNGRSLARVPLPNRVSRDVVFAPDGATAAIATIAMPTRSSQVTIYDATIGRVFRTFPGAESPMAFSPDGNGLATVTAGNTMTIWDTQSGAKRVSIPEQAAAIAAIAFSPDGARLALLSADGAVALFDTATGRETLVLRESSGPYAVQDWIVAGRGALIGRTLGLAFSEGGTQIRQTMTMSDPKGLRLQVKTWRTTPRRER